jgi:hypothetical protein
MPQQLCREEDILRAVSEAHWDGKRLDTDLFEGKGISVSRLAISSFPELCCIFRATIKAPTVMAAEINVGNLQDIGTNHLPSKELTVEEVPFDDNPAHAEIPQRISTGLARKIVNALILKDMV